MDENAQASGHADPDDEAPWAAQVVVHLPKDDPPTHLDVCAAVATAVARMVTDERAVSGEWEPLVTRWHQGRIRKLVRRARGSAWDRACTLPGITATYGTATAHACVPGPTNQVPVELRKLQVSGLELEQPAAAPPRPAPVVVVLSPDVQLTTGKFAAQAAHGAHVAALNMPTDLRDAWAMAGCPLSINHVDAETFEAADWPVVIRDAGFTETSGVVTTTAKSIWTFT